MQTAWYEALACMEHQHCRRQAPTPEPESIYWLEMEVGRGGSENKGEQEEPGRGAAANPVADRRGGKDTLDGAAVRRRGAAASGREDRGVGSREAVGREPGVQGSGRKADRSEG